MTENWNIARYARAYRRRAVQVAFSLLAAATLITVSWRRIDAADSDLHIKELLAGANGNSRVQFLVIEQQLGQNLWGPQSGETESRTMLVFYDASGRETGKFKFPANPGTGGSLKTLIATPDFASLPGAPVPDVLIPPLFIPIAGKVCFKNNPANSAATIRNECVSYGPFTGDTEINQIGNNGGVSAGAPAATLPIVDTVSLRRTTYTGHNSDFQLTTTPTPTNIAGLSLTIPVASLPEQGRNLFNNETFLGNGRTCATCHQAGDNLRLSPANIQSRFATLAAFSFDPLFIGEFKPSSFDAGFDFNLNRLVLTSPVATPAPCTGELRGDITTGNGARGKVLARVNSTTYLVYGGFNPMLTGVVTDGVCTGTVTSVTAGNLAVPSNSLTPGLEDPRKMRISGNTTLFPQGRGLILENIDGFASPPVFRKSPHLLNLSRTAPFGLSGNFTDLQSFITFAVAQHLPRTLSRNVAGSNPDFRVPAPEEIAALEAFLRAQEFPAGDDPNKYDLDRFATTNSQRIGRSQFFGTPTSPNCSTCHGGPLLSQTTLSLQGKPIGVNASFNTGAHDLLITGDSLPCEPAGDCNSREFSTPSLFNVNNLGPFFHNASTANLTAALNFYNSFQFLLSPAGAAMSAQGIPISLGSSITTFLAGLTVRPYTLSAGPVRFGVQPSAAGPTATQTITLTNTGSSPLAFSTLPCFLTGANASQFVISSCPIPTSLGAGQSVNVMVAFDPTSSGLKSANLEFNTTIPSGIDLFGVGDVLPAAPTLSSVVGTSGTAAGGDSLTLAGTNFANGAIVTIGGVRAGFITVLTATSITLRTGPHAPGTVDVIVTNPDGQAATLPNGFTYIPAVPLSLTSVTPGSGSGLGSSITITGQGIQGGARITLGGVPASNITVVTSTRITATTGPHTPGSVDMCVTNPDGQRACLPAAYTYVPGSASPAISAVAPASGSYLGGTNVTILGSGFAPGGTVTFGGAAATIINVTPTSMTARTSAHAPGLVDVVVTNGDGQTTTRANGYSYLPPEITSVAPNSGSTNGGTSVSIGGSGFAIGATVTFGGSPATNVVASSNHASINAVTPAHLSGPVTVVVTNPDGQVASLANAFTYILPTITTISPSLGSSAGGTQVTISGSGFAPNATVTFGGVAALNVLVGGTSISVTTPAHAAGTVDVVVTNPDGSSVTRSSGFTYISPTITSLSPGSGSTAGGTQISISGSGFAPGAVVTFGGLAATITFISESSISVRTPAHAAGSVNVVVTNSDLSSATRVNGFTYILPTITSISPATGSTVGGTSVSITGLGFAPGLTVTFAGLTATVTFVGETSISLRTPAHATGSVNVVVTNSDLSSTTRVNGFTYVQPTITSVSPSTGGTSGGTGVTIGGTAFAPGLTVMFGGVAATNISLSGDSAIFATTPAHAPGIVDVLVTNSDGSSATRFNGFTYVLPTITSVSPTSGGIGGGTFVSINGSGFVQGTTVTFGGAVATITSLGSTFISLRTPAHAAGIVNVVVTNPDGSSATMVNAFSYIPLALTSVSPNNGNVSGGTLVSIGGSGFVTGATVTFGGLTASVLNVNESSILVRTPAHAAGSVDVVVTNPDGSTVTSASGFTYGLPVITSVSPSTGTSAGGTFVEVNGTGFTPGATVTFGGISGVDIFSNSETRVTARTPPHAPGNVDVVVTNPNGNTITRTNGFTYLVPTITSISPATGSTVGGTFVEINGAAFAPGATIMFGGIAATDVFTNFESRITARTPAHAAGIVDVVVTNLDGSTVTRVNGFTYVLPAITSVSPNSGTSAGGTGVTINGVGFLPGVKATFGGAAATSLTVSGETTIFATTPPHAAGSVPLVLTNLDGSTVTRANAFTYVSPAISSISPDSGSTGGGASVVINGSGFAQGVVVRFGGAAATIGFSNESSIFLTTPAHAAGIVNVVVTNPDGSTATRVNGFNYVLPTISSVFPSTGSIAGGTLVDINGSGFSPGVTVSFGGVLSPETFRSETRISARTPPHASGTVNIVVTNPDGSTATSFNSFNYIPPTITTVSPASGNVGGGTNLTIFGSGFASGSTLTFGGVPALGISVSGDGLIFATTPAHALGFVDVVLTIPGGATFTKVNGFQYVPPAISSISPSSGPSNGGTFVSISGSGFVPGLNVTFGGVPATNIFGGDTSISARTPAHAEGPVDVVVTNPNGATSTSVNGFTFTPSITISAIIPTSGSSLGATPVAIVGSGFTGGATVQLGGVSATNVVVETSTTITAVTPPHTPGLVGVLVTNPDGATGTRPSSFNFVAAPVPQVTGITPDTGSSLGGTSVTISGANFAPTAAVKLGGVSATNVVFVNSGTLTAISGPHAAGFTHVEVINPDGQSGMLQNGFRYLAAPPPAITSLLPASGSTLGGTAVTVVGTGFGNGATLTIGGQPATNVVFVNSTTLLATTAARAAGIVAVSVTNPDNEVGTLPNGFTYTVTPFNDNFANRSPITGTGPITVAGSNVGATSETGEPPDTNDVRGTPGIWWTWAATCTFSVTSPTSFINTLGSNFDTVLAVFTGSSLSSLVPFAFDDDSGENLTSRIPGALSSSPVNIAAGTVFQIRVRSFSVNTTGAVVLHIDSPCGISAVTPSSGPTAGGTPVTILGSGFMNGATVAFGGVSATAVTVVNSTTILATTGARSPDLVPVTVTNPNATIATLPNGFLYTGGPRRSRGQITSQ